MFMAIESVVFRGLLAMGFSLDKQDKMSNTSKETQFHAHYGLTPPIVAQVWNDLCTLDVEGATIPVNERNPSGFHMYLAAHFYMWNKPRNAKVLASRFQIAESRAQGQSLWKWIKRMAALKAVKIVWDQALDDQDSEVFIVSLDGVDFPTRQEKHETLPRDPQMYSHKSNGPAWKYEIALCVFRDSIVHASGPEKASVHDLTMFRNNGLKEKMLTLPGKMIIADKGYKTTEPDEIGVFSIPNPMDNEDVGEFKARVRLRQETINARMKTYAILKHGFELTRAQHEACFYAVLVLQQYKIENGSTLYQP